jgi:hypothetical protein
VDKCGCVVVPWSNVGGVDLGDCWGCLLGSGGRVQKVGSVMGSCDGLM